MVSAATLRFSAFLARSVCNLSVVKCPVITRGIGGAYSRTTLARVVSTSAQTQAKREWVEITYEVSDGQQFTVKGKEGDNLLDVVINNDVDLDGFGACEGTLACSTCHLIFEKEDFDQIDEPCTDEELDMLDLAYGLSDTSRLGCQVCLTKALNGITVKVPEGRADARTA